MAFALVHMPRVAAQLQHLKITKRLTTLLDAYINYGA
jgi:hypothetical protein